MATSILDLLKGRGKSIPPEASRYAYYYFFAKEFGWPPNVVDSQPADVLEGIRIIHRIVMESMGESVAKGRATANSKGPTVP